MCSSDLEKWTEAGIYLKISAIGGLLFPLQSVCANIIMLKGKTKNLLIFAFIKHGLRIALLLAFIKSGVLALAIVFSLSTMIGSLLYISLGMKYLQYSIIELFKDLYKTIFASFIGIGFVVLINELLANNNTILIFSLQLLIMAIVFIISSKLFKNEFLKETISLISPLIKK